MAKRRITHRLGELTLTVEYPESADLDERGEPDGWLSYEGSKSQIHLGLRQMQEEEGATFSYRIVENDIEVLHVRTERGRRAYTAERVKGMRLKIISF
jgi:hypothetical protein